MSEQEATLDDYTTASKTEVDPVEQNKSRFWGEVPGDWELVQPDGVYEVNPNPKPVEEPSTYIEMDALDTVLPWPRYFGERNAAEFSGKTFSSGDTLFARITPCTENGKAALVPEMRTRVGIGSTEFAVLSPKRERISPWYLFYLSKSHPVHNYAISRMRGSTGRQRVPFDVFRRELDIALPPLEEQRKIASVLYTVDQVIQKTEEIIEQTERVKQGVRQDILTRGMIDGDSLRYPPEKSQEVYEDTRNWTIPRAWELKKLSEVCTLQVGYAYESNWYRDTGEVRVLRGANVGYGKPDWSDTKYLEPKRVEEYQEYRLDSGDIIIGMDRPYTSSGFKISRLSERDIPSLLVQRVGRYQPNDIDKEFLHVVLSDWRYQKQVLRRAQGMDIPHISKMDILSPKIPVPPRQEQERIAEIIATMRERVQSEKKFGKQLKRLKQGLMQDLLSGEVRTHDKDIEIVDDVLKHG